MTPARLHPPLPWIERGLFGDSVAESEGSPADEVAGSVDDLGQQAAFDPATGDRGWSPEQRRLLLDMARRSRLEVRDDLPMAPGQIRKLHLPYRPQRPVHLLVDRVGPLLAHGWLVVSEADYASDTDWVLQDDDVVRPLALSTALVQMWNKRQLPLACLGGSVNELQEDRLHGLQIVASQAHAPDRPSISDPLATFSVVELSGVEYVTGAPLSPDARHPQERRAYRDLYERWAETLVIGELTRLGTPPGKPLNIPSFASVPDSVASPADAQHESAKARSTGASGRWRTLALASMAALAVAVIWPLSQMESDTDAQRYRSVLPSGVAADSIRVHLAPATSVHDLSDWLVRWSAQMGAGPDESGAFRLLVPRDISQAALADLQNSPLVEKAQMEEQP